MIRYFTYLLIFVLLTASSVVSASAIEVSKACCCSEAAISQRSIETAIQNNCLCCAPLPAHKIPTKIVQVEIKPICFDLQSSPLLILPFAKLDTIKIAIDRRRPLHLASNQLYLKKRALLL